MLRIKFCGDKLQILILFILNLVINLAVMASAPEERLVPRLKGFLRSPYGYWEYKPAGYSSSSKLPVVIYLHGIKESGDGESIEALEKILLNGPPLLIKRYAKDFKFILIAPQSPGLPEGFSAENVDLLIDIVKKNYAIDGNRIYITGLSYGGYATWRTAAYSKKKLAAAMPICSCGDSPDPNLLQDLPIWSFVNAGDYAIPGCLNNLTKRINAAGGQAHLTIYPKKGHNAWTQTFMDDSVWEWLLSQRKLNNGENAPPVIVNPGNQSVTIGYPSKFRVMVTDANNDPSHIAVKDPLPNGVKYEVDKDGSLLFTINAKVAGAHNITIQATDGKGGSATQTFTLRTAYSPLITPIVFLLITLPIAWLIPLLPSLLIQCANTMNAIATNLSFIKNALSFRIRNGWRA